MIHMNHGYACIVVKRLREKGIIIPVALVDSSVNLLRPNCLTADMHLKNFSLWRPSPDRIVLSPAYDLLVTRILLPSDQEESALALNGKKKNLRRKDFKALANTMGINAKVQEKTFARFTASLPEMYHRLENCVLSPDLALTYRELLRERAQRLGL